MIWFASRLIRTCFLMGCFVLAGLIGLPQVAPAATEVSDRLAGCARIDDNAARLECFDEMTGRKKSGSGKDREVRSEAKAIPASEKLSETKRPPSVMEKHWDLGDESQRQKSFVLRPYRMNYFLPVAYNSSPNDETNLEYDPAAKAQFNEAKFQLSFKVKVFEGLFQGRLPDVYDRLKVPQRFQVVREADVWAGYTQLCFWQLYNSAFSSPFRDTNYEPEFLLNLRMDYEILGFQGRFVSVGFNHQSNGRSRPLSRSWNRIVANIGLERENFIFVNDNFGLQFKTWYRFPEDSMNDDNPDLTRYMGYGEIWATYILDKQRFALMLRNNLRRNNLGAVQVDWSIPPITLGILGRRLFGPVLPDCALKYFSEEYLTDKFSFYIQYFNGYGEGLMDYNKSINRISAGIMLAEWN